MVFIKGGEKPGKGKCDALKKGEIETALNDVGGNGRII